jgi:tripartite-type tricarboxylate transporter receptor subunit TctC
MPRGAPKVAIQWVNAAAQKAMEDQAIAKRFAEIGADIPPLNQRTPEALGRLVAVEIDKWVPLIKAAGVAAQ